MQREAPLREKRKQRRHSYERVSAPYWRPSGRLGGMAMIGLKRDLTSFLSGSVVGRARGDLMQIGMWSRSGGRFLVGATAPASLVSLWPRDRRPTQPTAAGGRPIRGCCVESGAADCDGFGAGRSGYTGQARGLRGSVRTKPPASWSSFASGKQSQSGGQTDGHGAKKKCDSSALARCYPYQSKKGTGIGALIGTGLALERARCAGFLRRAYPAHAVLGELSAACSAI